MKYVRLLSTVLLFCFLFPSGFLSALSDSEIITLKQIEAEIVLLEQNLATERKRVKELRTELQMYQKDSEKSEQDLERLQKELTAALTDLWKWQDKSEQLQKELTKLEMDSQNLTERLAEWKNDAEELERQLTIYWTEIERLTKQRNQLGIVAVVEFGLIILFIIF